jgi:16S rRNA C1402 (ribose-2'-O) methylase RsmI
MDLVYARPELKDLSSRMNIPQAHSKRSSEASLLRLNNDLTNMINTFEKAHGTIGNELTRSNMTNSMKKIRELNEPANDVLKKKRTVEVVTINEEAPLPPSKLKLDTEQGEGEAEGPAPKSPEQRPHSHCDSIH